MQRAYLKIRSISNINTRKRIQLSKMERYSQNYIQINSLINDTAKIFIR